MMCPHCGKPIADGSEQCPACGKKTLFAVRMHYKENDSPIRLDFEAAPAPAQKSVRPAPTPEQTPAAPKAGSESRTASVPKPNASLLRELSESKQALAQSRRLQTPLMIACGVLALLLLLSLMSAGRAKKELRTLQAENAELRTELQSANALLREEPAELTPEPTSEPTPEPTPELTPEQTPEQPPEQEEPQDKRWAENIGDFPPR